MPAVPAGGVDGGANDNSGCVVNSVVGRDNSDCLILTCG